MNFRQFGNIDDLIKFSQESLDPLNETDEYWKEQAKIYKKRLPNSNISEEDYIRDVRQEQIDELKKYDEDLQHQNEWYNIETALKSYMETYTMLNSSRGSNGIFPANISADYYHGEYQVVIEGVGGYLKTSIPYKYLEFIKNYFESENVEAVLKGSSKEIKRLQKETSRDLESYKDIPEIAGQFTLYFRWWNEDQFLEDIVRYVYDWSLAMGRLRGDSIDMSDEDEPERGFAYTDREKDLDDLVSDYPSKIIVTDIKISGTFPDDICVIEWEI